MATSTTSRSGSGLRWLVAGLLTIVAVLAAIVAILYFAKTAGALPTWMPGHKAGSTGHHTRRAIAAAVVAVVLLIVAGIAASFGRRAKA